MHSSFNKFYFLVLIFSGLSGLLNGQELIDNYWQPADKSTLDAFRASRYLFPTKALTLEMDLSKLKQELRDVSVGLEETFRTDATTLSLVFPDRTTKVFRIAETPVMAPALAARFPQIKTYSGVAVDNPAERLFFDITEEGFHAMVLSPGQSSMFIDPYAKGDTKHYLVYYKKDYQRTSGAPFVCGTEGEELVENIDFREAMTGDTQLRTYRLALACTGEYASFHGGTVAGVLSAMNTTMNRVNGVYLIDAGVRMEIIANNDQLIFLNASTDPYTNNDGFAMLDENQATVDDVIGTANYDIGHVFSTGGGGVAQLGSVCGASGKARGVTGSGNPVGDAFDIDYVAHEMGHQFGANHTQNNSCNFAFPASVEVGSGSSIMGYAGICAPNVQNHSDDYFGGYSVFEIKDFIVGGGGDVCPVKTNTGNHMPVGGVTPESNIPKSTPFSLAVDAGDEDGDALTYCWEEMDPDAAPMPPEHNSSVGPMFRSLSPTLNPERYFPNLDAIRNNTTPTWEVLPSVGRELNFKCTVRDNHPGGGATEAFHVQVHVAGNSGPFVVTAPNGGETLAAGQTYTVTWDVANTTAAPVNCADVDILLSTDDGLTYPVVLANRVDNTGSYTLTVPNEVGTNNRIMVRGWNNIFFDISNAPFTIENVEPGFDFSVAQSLYAICTDGNTDVVFTVDSYSGFDEDISVTYSGEPDGVTITGITNPVSYGENTFHIAANDVTPGVYPVTLTATATGGSSHTSTFDLVIENHLDLVTLVSPASGATEVPLDDVVFQWQPVDGATSYDFYLYEGGFSDPNPLHVTLTDNQYVASGLSSLTNYLWTVLAHNDCSSSEPPEEFTFQTLFTNCLDFENHDMTFITYGEDIESVINVSQDMDLTDVNVSFDISHTWVGDLYVDLMAPDGTIVNLIDRPGVPASNYGCDQDNLSVTMDDEADEGYDVLESTCTQGDDYAIQGSFASAGLQLSELYGESSEGEWKLIVRDMADGDDGQLNNWHLELCGGPAVLSINIDTIDAPCHGENGAIVLDISGGTPPYYYSLDNMNYNDYTGAIELPQGVYDLYVKDAVDSVISVGVTIYEPDELVVSAAVEGNQLVVTAGGGTPPYTYSLNGGEFGDNPVFDGLQNGEYEVTVQDAHGCTTSITTEVTIPMSVEIQVEQPILCFGETGLLAMVVTGGTPPYEYTMDSDTATTGEMNIFEAAAGNHVFNVTDAGENTVTVNFYFEQPDALSATIDISDNEVTVTGEGGTPPYLYAVDDGGFAEDNVFSFSNSGTHTVSVMDSHECVFSKTIQVEVPFMLDAIEIAIPANCYGDSVVLAANVSGGTPPYTFNLTGETSADGEFIATMYAGGYVFIFTDSTGEEITVEYEITEPDELTAELEITGNTVTVQANGGTPPYTYVIGTGELQEDGVFEDVPAGENTIYVIDANGCTVEVPFEIVTGIKVFDGDEFSFDIQPNPNNGQFTLAGKSQEDAVNVEIFNVAGQKVFEKQLNANGNSFTENIHHGFVNGVYIVKLTSGANVAVKRMVVE